jgi:MFS transporter, FHS family, Na+ dependent glucose transporter 1
LTFPSTTLTESAAPTENMGRIAKTIGYYAAFIALGLAAAVLGPTLPGLAAHTGTRLGEISFLFTAKGLGYLLGSLQGGRWFDRVPGHYLIAAMLGVVSLTLALVPLASSLGLLVVVILLLGAAEGTLDVGGNTLLVWVHRRGVGPFMNGLHFFFGLGAFLAPLIIAGAIAQSGDINWAYWALALLALPAAGWLLRLPSPTPQIAPARENAAQINRLLAVLLTLFFFLYVGIESSFGGWIFTYATSLRLSSTETAALLTSAFWGALTVGRLLSIPLAVRFTPQGILSADLTGCFIGVGMILLWQNSLAAVWSGTLLAGFAMASIFPTLLSFAERRMTITARVSRWFFVGSGAGGMTLPWLIGQLFESIGPRAMMFAILTSLVLTVVAFAALLLASRRAVEQ